MYVTIALSSSKNYRLMIMFKTDVPSIRSIRCYRVPLYVSYISYISYISHILHFRPLLSRKIYPISLVPRTYACSVRCYIYTFHSRDDIVFAKTGETETGVVEQTANGRYRWKF